MSRGALLLQSVEADRELEYVAFSAGAVRRGPRAPGVAKTRRKRMAPGAAPPVPGVDHADA
jgi:hypothetical protein